MSEDRVTAVRKGLGLPSALGITFIVLKLTNYISWPWLWVLSPFWISFGFWFLLLIVIFFLLEIRAQ